MNRRGSPNLSRNAAGLRFTFSACAAKKVLSTALDAVKILSAGAPSERRYSKADLPGTTNPSQRFRKRVFKDSIGLRRVRVSCALLSDHKMNRTPRRRAHISACHEAT